MKKLIKDVLDEMAKSQVNLASEAAQDMIVNLIMAGIKEKGWYLDLGSHKSNDNVCLHNNNLNSTCSECDEQQAMDSWVCKICNKSTYDVEWDYIGSGTNHLECELKLEMND